MRKLVCIVIALSAGLVWAATAVAVTGYDVLPKIAQSNNILGCTHGRTGYSYSGVETPKNASGFVAGAPGSPITRTTIIEPMALSVTGANDHSVGYWGVGSQDANANNLTWIQVGVTIGAVPQNGWNQLGLPPQILSVPTMYVEYMYHQGANNQNYYFATVGASSGLYHYDYYSIRQETDGTFTGLVNSVEVGPTHVSVPQQTGRWTSGLGEDLSNSDTACENQDLYYEMVTPTTGLTSHYFEARPLDLEAMLLGSGPTFYDWESWNTNYYFFNNHGRHNVVLPPGQMVGTIWQGY